MINPLELVPPSAPRPKPRKRRPGEGTVLQLPSGRWRVGIPGPRGRVWLDETFATEEEADRERIATIKAILADGGGNGGERFTKWAAIVLDRRELDGYRSIKSTRRVYRAHLAKAPFAEMPIDKISRAMVRRWLRGVMRGRAAQTARNALNLLSAIFAEAVEDELLEANPCTGIKVREKGKTEDELRPLSVESVERLRAKANPETEWPIIGIAIGLGLRQGELRALRLVDVTIKGDDPHVMVRFGDIGKPTKSGKPRKVPLFGFALDAMKAWIDALPEFCPPSKNERGLVFPTENGNPRAAGHVLGKVGGVERRCRWKLLLEEAGLPSSTRWHDLRHTCATWLLAGVFGHTWSKEEVQAILGHASIVTTERYAKLLADTARGAARITEGSREKASIAWEAGISRSHPRDLNPRPAVYEALAQVEQDRQVTPPRDPSVISSDLDRAAARRNAPAALAFARELALAVLDRTEVRLAVEILGNDEGAVTKALRLADLLERPVDATEREAAG